ncbi:MAG: hypothetical protein ABR507_01220 [Actinomycetota bacterium]|nr:hypothetical protein [Actinomycetota bacterium]
MTPSYYAGATESVDLCSVSLCDPHYLIYPSPPAGGSQVQGEKRHTSSSVYDIAVPAAAVGGINKDSLLEEVMGFGTSSAASSSVILTNAQADADSVPLMIEGTKTFNFAAATVSAFRSNRDLAPTGASAWWVMSALVSIIVALGSVRRPRGLRKA